MKSKPSLEKKKRMGRLRTDSEWSLVSCLLSLVYVCGTVESAHTVPFLTFKTLLSNTFLQKSQVGS